MSEEERQLDIALALHSLRDLHAQTTQRLNALENTQRRIELENAECKTERKNNIFRLQNVENRLFNDKDSLSTQIAVLTNNHGQLEGAVVTATDTAKQLLLDEKEEKKEDKELRIAKLNANKAIILAVISGLSALIIQFVSLLSGQPAPQIEQDGPAEEEEAEADDN